MRIQTLPQLLLLWVGQCLNETELLTGMPRISFVIFEILLVASEESTVCGNELAFKAFFAAKRERRGD